MHSGQPAINFIGSSLYHWGRFRIQEYSFELAHWNGVGRIIRDPMGDPMSQDRLMSKIKNAAKNEGLRAAKAAKNDEFYTQYADIQKEIETYLESERGCKPDL